jgi:hypothetical protein
VDRLWTRLREVFCSNLDLKILTGGLPHSLQGKEKPVSKLDNDRFLPDPSLIPGYTVELLISSLLSNGYRGKAIPPPLMSSWNADLPNDLPTRFMV